MDGSAGALSNVENFSIIRVRSFDVATFVAFGAAHFGIAVPVHCATEVSPHSSPMFGEPLFRAALQLKLLELFRAGKEVHEAADALKERPHFPGHGFGESTAAPPADPGVTSGRRSRPSFL